LPDHVITDTHQLDILGAIAVLLDNGGRLPERQTDLDVIDREPEPQRVRNRDGVPADNPISFIFDSSIFHIIVIAIKHGTEKLEGVSLRDRFGLSIVLIKLRLEEQVANQLVDNRDIGNIERDELLGAVRVGMDSRSLLLVEERLLLFRTERLVRNPILAFTDTKCSR
jgi:hypothetical protein